MQKEDSFRTLVDIVAQLRNPNGGCPWDLEQTHESLTKYLEEETQEVLDVIAAGNDRKDLEEELGDVLLQVMLHSQIASEEGTFTIDDVVQTLTEKLIRRHPHVFDDSTASSIEEVQAQWDEIKKQEKMKKEKS